jgi:folate-binding protein YgfZ
MMAATESSGKTTDNFGSGVHGIVPLASLGVLRARGADTVTFLQGQLSSDVTQLRTEQALLGGYHNPQGRVIALLRLIAIGPEDVLAVLPRELVAPVAQRLSRFILRAKVKLTDDSPAWRIDGITGSAPAYPQLPQAHNQVQPAGAALVVRVTQHPARWLRLAAAAGDSQSPADGPVLGEATWRALGIAAGEPEVSARTSEEFVAQMLNLDCLGAIALDKGCYTGQEVIARAHYRGRVKRRMQRFRTLGPHTLAAGDGGTLADARPFKVVEAVALADGCCEFLAVTALAADGTRAAPEALAVESLPLPYPLPD